MTADPTGLGVGMVSGTLFITGSITVQVPVTFTVGSLGVSPQSLQFNYTLNSNSFPAAQTLSLSGNPVGFTAAPSTSERRELAARLAPTSGTTPATLSVQLNTQVVSTLTAGTYNGSVTVTPANQAAISIPVTLTVSGPAAVTVNPASLTFNFQTGQANPATQSITVTVTPAQQLAFTLTSTVTANPAGKNWIAVVPSGITAVQGTLVISVASGSFRTARQTLIAVRLRCRARVIPRPWMIPVTLVVSNLPLLNVPNAALNFTSQVAGVRPLRRRRSR